MTSYINRYDGLRKLTIARGKVGETGTPSSSRQVVVMLGNKVGADGLDLDISPIEQTIESYQTTYTVPVGVELKPATLHLIPFDIEDKGALLPTGYVAGKSWNMVTEGCDLDDCTVAFEKVCQNSDGSNGVNWIFRHARLSIAAKTSVKRATTTQLDISMYLIPTPGSEYGLDGTLSDRQVAWQEYFGTYDPQTDQVNFDQAA